MIIFRYRHTNRHWIIIYLSSTCRLASIDVADWSDQIYSFFTGDQTGINFITNIGLQVTNVFSHYKEHNWAICGKIQIIFAVCLQSSWLPQQSLGVAGCEQRVLFESQEIGSFAFHVWFVLWAKDLPFDLTSNSLFWKVKSLLPRPSVAVIRLVYTFWLKTLIRRNQTSIQHYNILPRWVIFNEN